jgi:hypothetical protein
MVVGNGDAGIVEQLVGADEAHSRNGGQAQEILGGIDAATEVWPILVQPVA